MCQNYGRFYNFMVYSIKKYITSLDPGVLYFNIGCCDTLHNIPHCKCTLNSRDINGIHTVVTNEEM